jgi:hypothetical protein
VGLVLNQWTQDRVANASSSTSFQPVVSLGNRFELGLGAVARGGFGEQSVDLAGEVALEAPDDFAL